MCCLCNYSFNGHTYLWTKSHIFNKKLKVLKQQKFAFCSNVLLNDCIIWWWHDFCSIFVRKILKFESSKSKKYSNMHFNQEFSLFISSRKKGAVEKSLDTVSLTCRYCTVYCSVRKLPTTQCNHIPPLISGPIQ